MLTGDLCSSWLVLVAAIIAAAPQAVCDEYGVRLPLGRPAAFQEPEAHETDQLVVAHARVRYYKYTNKTL